MRSPLGKFILWIFALISDTICLVNMVDFSRKQVALFLSSTCQKRSCRAVQCQITVRLGQVRSWLLGPRIFFSRKMMIMRWGRIHSQLSDWVGLIHEHHENREIHQHLIEPTCAIARWAHMRHFLSVCLYFVSWPNFRLDRNSDLTKIHIPGTVWPLTFIFGTRVDLDLGQGCIVGQGRRSKVKVK